MNFKSIAGGGLALLILSNAALAQYRLGNYDLTGSAQLGGRVVGGNAEDSAWFNRYTDVTDGVFGSAIIDANRDAYNMQLKALDIGRDDQEYRLSGRHFGGGMLGSMSYELFYNEIIHNLGFDGNTIYTGVGTTNLTFAGATKPTTAFYTNPFEYSFKHKNFGLSTEFFRDRPYFVNVGYNRVVTDGLKPLGTQTGVLMNGTSGMGYTWEVPQVLDQTTDNVTVATGYRTSAFAVDVTGLYSTFDNKAPIMTFKDPFQPTQLAGANVGQELIQSEWLDQDNDYYSANLQGTFFNMPLDSSLSWDAGYSRISSDFALQKELAYGDPGTSAAQDDAQLLTLGTSRDNFDGTIEYYNAGASWNVAPIDKVNASVFYKFLKKHNSSSLLTYTNPLEGDTVTNEVFDYTKNNAGIDAHFKAPAHTKLGVGYDAVYVSREGRFDAPVTLDHKAFVELHNDYLDKVTAKVKYTRLERRNNQDDTYLFEGNQQWLRRFDVAEKHHDIAQVGVDIAPMENLMVGVEYRYNDARFYETQKNNNLGLLFNRGHEGFLSADYEIPRIVTLNAYGDVVKAKKQYRMRTLSPGTTNFNPNAAPNATNYNSESVVRDTYWSTGASATIPLAFVPGVGDKLSLFTGVRYENGNGEQTFAVQSPGPFAPSITPYMDYRRRRADASLSYKVINNLTATAGYAFEQLETQDIGMDSYSYVIPNTGTIRSFLAGMNRDNDYFANVYYVSAQYTF